MGTDSFGSEAYRRNEGKPKEPYPYDSEASRLKNGEFFTFIALKITIKKNGIFIDYIIKKEIFISEQESRKYAG